MNTITNIFKRFVKAGDNTQGRRTVAAVVEPVEGRVLMSGSLLTTTTALGDGSVRPTESLSLNFTKITYTYKSQG